MAYTTIKNPSDYFNTKLYSGTGSTQNITGVGFQPDLTWVKSRTSAEAHVLRDVVRGNFRLNTASTGAETDATSSISGFVSDGFTVATADAVNNASQTYASWSWLASNTTASNTDGSITSTVSANTTSGFSIVSYTGNGTSGATVGHGISTPDVIIAKSRSGVHNWYVYHKSNGVGYGKLNLSDAFNSATDVFTVAPTSSVFTISADTSINNSGDNFIAYCFAEKKGFSKFGSYIGNGNADGAFVYTGFKPAFIMIKGSSLSSDWNIWDNKRPDYNVVNRSLEPHQSDAETVSAGRDIDILSNGFKARGTSSSMNSSGATYIYMAFAEEPLVGDNPATAR